MSHLPIEGTGARENEGMLTAKSLVHKLRATAYSIDKGQRTNRFNSVDLTFWQQFQFECVDPCQAHHKHPMHPVDAPSNYEQYDR